MISLTDNEGSRGVVVSVPHSGTRTLVAHLSLPSLEEQRLGSKRWWHFGFCHHLLDKYPKVLAHIPIRNPMDVAKSWALRNKHGRQPEKQLVLCYHHMLEHFGEKPDQCRFYRMEDLPKLEGVGEHGDVRNLSKVRAYQDRVRQDVVAGHPEFFARFGY